MTVNICNALGMATKPPATAARDEVLCGLQKLFEDRGFSKAGSFFNRTTQDGLTQVINFQMSRSNPPISLPASDQYPQSFGKFTVNLGVFIPEVALLSFPKGTSAPIHDYDCEIRARLGKLGPERKELWWQLSADALPTEDIRLRLERDGLPYLDKLLSRDAVLVELENPTPGTALLNPKIAIACILATRGQTADARTLLQSHVEEESARGGNEGHIHVVNRYALKLGLGRLTS
jgi:hypothetical protein